MGNYLLLFGKPRYFGIVKNCIELDKGGRVLVSTPRGDEMAVVICAISAEKEQELLNQKVHHDPSEGGRGAESVAVEVFFSSRAAENHIAHAEELRSEEAKVLPNALRMLASDHKLGIKLIDVEYLLERKKLFFYFTADSRVDFRAFVRDLARVYRTRIEMREVGIRDEARIAGGLAPCGRPCCCSYWMHQFAPICIKMVKEQNLALNPSKISGICGRLMCCMGFEHEVYKELWANIPGPGSRIKAPAGIYTVQGMVVEKRSVRCSAPRGPELLVPIEKFSQFRDAVINGEEWTPPEAPEQKRYDEAVVEITRHEPREQTSEDSTSGDGANNRRLRRRRRKKPSLPDIPPVDTAVRYEKPEKPKADAGRVTIRYAADSTDSEEHQKGIHKKSRRRRRSGRPDNKNTGGGTE